MAEFKATYAILNQDCYRSSPFRAIFDEGVGGSANAFVPGLELDYPILEELRVAGATGCCRRTWNDGDRQMVAILSAVLTDGLTCVEAACAAAPQGVIRIGTSTVRPTDILQQQSPYNLTSSP